MTAEAIKIRCRFAPSPTGMLHVGGARTALFNYLFARATGGSYLLRIEDSDRERSTPEAVEAILKGLEWLGLLPDEAPVFQSEREGIYQTYVQQLLASGHAYPCTVSAEELDEIREQQRLRGEKPRYDGRCRPAEITPQSTNLPSVDSAESFVIRIRMPELSDITFEDQVLGIISTPIDELDDFILIRSDGTPTYNLVNVIDDLEMGITHVLRGNEHVANTPKQIAIYRALGQALPVFAHFPLILGPDKKKLSKRHGATAVFEYRSDGYLADAFINYLARLGWSDGDDELFSRSELEQRFSLHGVGKSPSVFDTEKLRWVNAEHMKRLELSQLIDALLPYLESCPAFSPASVPQPEQVRHSLASTVGESVLREIRERARTLVELAEGIAWLFVPSHELIIDENDKVKCFKPELAPIFDSLLLRLEELELFRADTLEAFFSEFLESQGLSFGKLGQPVRLALVGKKAGISIFLAAEALGKPQTLERLRRAREWIPAAEA